MVNTIIDELPMGRMRIFIISSEDDWMVLMPELQAGYLAGLLSRKIGMNLNKIKVESVYPFKKYFTFLKDNINLFPEDYYIFYLENIYHSSVYGLAFLKEMLPLIPNKHVIVHSFKLTPEEAYNLMELYPQIQLVIHSDIEFVFSEIYIKKKELTDIANITFRSGKDILMTHKENVNYDLGDYIFPAYIDGHILREKASFNYILSLLDEDDEKTNDKIRYRRSKKKHIKGMYASSLRNSVYLATGRGCSWGCSYCSRGSKYASVRKIPLEVIKQDLDYLSSIGVKEVILFDDDFLLTNYTRLPEIVALLESYDFTYSILTRYEMCTEENLKLLQNLKLAFVQIGLQTIEDNIFTKRRKVKIDKFSDVVNRLKKQGALVAIDLILGLPGETIYNFLNTFKYAISLAPKNIAINSLFLNPSTELYGKKEELDIVTKPSDIYVELYNVDTIAGSKTFPSKDLEKARKVVLRAMDLFPDIYFTLR